MGKTKKINKGISAVLASALIAGGTSQVAIAATINGGTVTEVRYAGVKASEETTEKWINVVTLPKVETTEFGKFYGDYDKYRVSFPGTTDKEFEEFQKYIKAINDTNKVTANGGMEKCNDAT